MKDENDNEHVYLEDLTFEAQEFVKSVAERSGETVEEALNRIVLEVGRREWRRQ